MKSIGTLKIKDLDGFLSDYLATPFCEFSSIDFFKKDQLGDDYDIVLDCWRYWFSIYQNGQWIRDGDQEKIMRELTARKVGELKNFFAFAETYGIPLNVGIWRKEFTFVFQGNPKKGILIQDPEKYFEFEPAPDFSNYTTDQFKAIHGVKNDNMQSMLPAESTGLSVAQVRSSLDQTQEQQKDLEDEIEAVQHYKEESLAQMKAEIERLEQEMMQKKAELLDSLNKKKEEMDRQLEQMNMQIFLLDSEIYAIRCYTGEVINFTRIRSGQNADIKVPIVIHQKLRFLDEDLARITSLYELQWEEMEMFEDFLKHSPAAIDLFVPEDRCISLVRMSRTGKSLGMDGDRPFQNLMTSYDYYHGNTVGILIRNGENLYLGWTDEERVHIDDDLLVGKIVTEVTPVEAVDEHDAFYSYRKKAEEEKARSERKKLVDGVISRSFVYNILQGLVDRTSILPLPDGVKLNKQSPYVVYSLADNWLTDNRFGSFSEIMDRCNKQITKGDMLLTMQSLVAERPYSGFNRGYYSSAYQNTRGRGDKNRTHDCRVSDCTLYPANMVEWDPPVKMIRYNNGNGCPCKATESSFNRMLKETPSEIKEKTGEYVQTHRHIFISVLKSYSQTGRARSNFEVYEHEFLNLTYMNSVWLKWCINNKKLGDWSVGGKRVIYSYGIRYLNKALDFVRNREQEEEKLLNAADPEICKDPDWPLKLSEWKMASGVRALTEYQANRFAKAYKTIEVLTNN